MNQITERMDREQTTGAAATCGPRFAALGLLTMAMSLLAGFAALRQRDGGLTTVGWLWWWLPAPLLFAAAASPSTTAMTAFAPSEAVGAGACSPCSASPSASWRSAPDRG